MTAEGEPNDWLKAAASRIVTAAAAISIEVDGKRGVAGTMACPNCENGRLRYSVASNNGHIHAVCSTEGCTRFMQ